MGLKISDLRKSQYSCHDGNQIENGKNPSFGFSMGVKEFSPLFVILDFLYGCGLGTLNRLQTDLGRRFEWHDLCSGTYG